MVAEYIAPLNLEYIFKNTLAGSSEVFFGLFFIAISVVAGLFRMPNTIFLLMIGLAGLMLYGWIPSGFYILVLLVAGTIVFWQVSRIVKT